MHSSTVYNSQDMEATHICIYMEYIYIYIYIYIWNINHINNKILSYSSVVDQENIMLSEMSDVKRQIQYDITYIWNPKNNTNELSMQNRNKLWKTNTATKGERE